jgi:hypothetical protein
VRRIRSVAIGQGGRMSGLRLMPVLGAILLALAGALAGLAIALLTPAPVQIAGADAGVRLHPGRAYDDLNLSGVLTGKRATTRSVLGEPVGISIRIRLDASAFVNSDGAFNTDVLPAYVQAYSDPEQLAVDLRWAVTKHILVGTVVGASLGLLVALGRHGLRRWRVRRNGRLGPERVAAAAAYLASERALRRRVGTVAVIVVLIAILPGAVRDTPHRAAIRPDPILAGTPLAGTQVGGILRPLLGAAKSYIETYFAQTNDYYNQLRQKLLALLDGGALALPPGSDDEQVRHFLYVTDRHCNIGMDRVIVALGEHFGIKLLVSGGDDAFSGTFPFESACTANLAAKSQDAGMTDVFVGGNHDSQLTLSDERDQKIKVLDGEPVTVDGLTFTGLPDPRSSRYGQGIQPASATERQHLLLAQGMATGGIACDSDVPVIVVDHDPSAGATAVTHGCGKALLALDGHWHKRAGPDPLPVADGQSAYRFVGASAGGAPGEGAVERSFASRLTVGPLNHDASVNIVTVDASTGRLVGVSECRFTPDQQISFDQQVVP